MARRGASPATVVALLLLIVGWTTTSCDKHARYRVLSVMFDGVPNPDEPNEKTARGTMETAMKEQPHSAESSPAESQPQSQAQPQSQTQAQPVTYRHPPADGTNDCSFCHGSLTSMVIPPRDICLKCHTHVHEKLRFVHGPAAVDCVACHNPHDSPTNTLLAKTVPLLCFDCHHRAALEKTNDHAGAGELECLSCHDPHGGNDRFFLKRGIVAD